MSKVRNSGKDEYYQNGESGSSSKHPLPSKKKGAPQDRDRYTKKGVKDSTGEPSDEDDDFYDDNPTNS